MKDWKGCYSCGCDREKILRTLVSLHEWMLSHTGPKDGTVDILTESHKVIEEMKKEMEL